ncbi:putative sulfate exporter family transporter [Arthrobacter sp. H20]|uniref:YeiH family protein n=1 Tax=Arthrobacter sp. H20 TaxID=1267981 RepID=UPI0004B153B8|nr:putative sulfate exporter family transporter [Arthrobacter sp. H20]
MTTQRSAATAAFLNLLPGVLVMAAAVALSLFIASLQGFIGALVVALGLGLLVRNTGLFHPRIRPGIQRATKRFLRLGVVVLGLQLSLPEILSLGFPVLALIIASVFISFLFTRYIGERLGLSRAASTLMAAGFSICGASAIAGMQSIVNADDDEVASAIAMVTLYGSAVILGLPLVSNLLGLSPETFGIWSGLAVHEVAQVVATASTAGAVALAVATVVKLGRVVLLAPVAAFVSIGIRRAEGGQPSVPGRVAPIVPLFVVGFLALVLVRSTGVVPEPVLDVASLTATLLLAAAMFGLGTGIDIPHLARTGGKNLALGGISTVFLGGITLAGAVLVTA